MTTLADLRAEGTRGRADLDPDYDARATVSGARFAALMAEYRAGTERCAHWLRHSGVVYDRQSGQKLDIYGPAGQGLPVFVFIHGGYWRALSRHDSGMMAGMLAERGIATVAVDYQLAPGATLTEILRQVRSALAFVFHEGRACGLDPARIHVGGSSAGGHLAAALASDDWQDGFGLPRDVVKSALPVSGLFELAPIAAAFPQDWLWLSEADVAALSPARHLPRPDLPVTVARAAAEAPGFERQSRAYAAALRAQGNPVTELEIPARNHFDVLMDLADPEAALSRALVAQILA
ncbi:alpha/beta hydrolase [Sinirhodobacter populi]|uniref:Alpha/beta hydrolase n=1 Tax=Paenirhodobacter populi TaxID=2306993 RepID=A0A443KDU2_9RHOB|nr:alpha/beta hydrolase [Sinirhodobacter populi]RWR31001.1 alpha/beta hydrolase [Sinirhodobacter populi]